MFWNYCRCAFVTTKGHSLMTFVPLSISAWHCAHLTSHKGLVWRCGYNLIFVFLKYLVSFFHCSFPLYRPYSVQHDETTLDRRETLHKLKVLSLKTAMVTVNLRKALHRPDLLLVCTESASVYLSSTLALIHFGFFIAYSGTKVYHCRFTYTVCFRV